MCALDVALTLVWVMFARVVAFMRGCSKEAPLPSFEVVVIMAARTARRKLAAAAKKKRC